METDHITATIGKTLGEDLLRVDAQSARRLYVALGAAAAACCFYALGVHGAIPESSTVVLLLLTLSNLGLAVVGPISGTHVLLAVEKTER